MYRLIYSDTLSHHGILGMKWGVRRYQNEDGSLTKAGMKRYYKNGKLSDKGKEYNRMEDERYKNSLNTLRYNVKRVNEEEYNKAYNDYLSSYAADRKSFHDNLAKWQRGEGEYKNKTYEQFRELSANNWRNSEQGKLETESYNQLRKLMQDGFNESPYVKYTYRQLPFNSLNSEAHIKTVRYGEKMVNEIMMDIYEEAIEASNK